MATAHDEINLRRFVRRLEKSVAEQEWNDADMPQLSIWIETQKCVQQVKFARKLLKNVESSTEPNASQTIQELDEITKTLNHLDGILSEASQRVAPPSQPSKPLLPLIPIPVLPQPPKSASPPSITDVPGRVPDELLLAPDAGPLSASLTSANDLLLSPSELSALPTSTSPAATLLSPSIPLATKSTAIDTGANARRRLQNSNVLQEELSDQLAQMAAQLKRNAVHFSESLVKDKAVVEDTGLKLESNFETMQKQKGRLGVYSKTSRSTTCLVLFAVLSVTLLFFIMVSIIRFT